MGASWQLVFGAALHWASLLYQGVEFSPSLGSPVDASRAITPLSACVAIALSLGAWRTVACIRRSPPPAWPQGRHAWP